MAIDFDFDAALKALRSGQNLNGENGILTPLIKQLTEAALKAELEQHIENDPVPNRKNGATRKTIKSTSGNFELNTPRDRAGTFEPQLVKKNQTHLTDELERKIRKRPRITLYAPTDLAGTLTSNHPPGVSHEHSRHSHRTSNALAAADYALATVRLIPGRLL